VPDARKQGDAEDSGRHAQAGTIFRVKSKGVRNLQGYGHGDLHVRVQVEVPSRLSHEQKAKLQEFAALCERQGDAASQGFLRRRRSFSSELNRPRSHAFVLEN